MREATDSTGTKLRFNKDVSGGAKISIVQTDRELEIGLSKMEATNLLAMLKSGSSFFISKDEAILSSAYEIVTVNGVPTQKITHIFIVDLSQGMSLVFNAGPSTADEAELLKSELQS